MEEQWDASQALCSYDGKPIFNRHDFEHSYSTLVDALLSQMEDRFYPPPEILLSIADCLLIYFIAEGKVELEENFLKKVERGKINYANRRAKLINM